MTPTNYPCIEQGFTKAAYECQYYVITLVKKEFFLPACPHSQRGHS